MDWYLKVLKNYAGFSGRARRSEFWMFTLVSVGISIVLAILDRSLGLSSDAGYGALGGLYALAVLVPSLAVSVRRLHDTDRSGWWLLISLIPLVGAIVLIVFLATAGKVGDNQYGADPKGVPADAAPAV